MRELTNEEMEMVSGGEHTPQLPPEELRDIEKFMKDAFGGEWSCKNNFACTNK